MPEVFLQTCLYFILWCEKNADWNLFISLCCEDQTTHLCKGKLHEGARNTICKGSNYFQGIWKNMGYEVSFIACLTWRYTTTVEGHVASFLFRTRFPDTIITIVSPVWFLYLTEESLPYWEIQEYLCLFSSQTTIFISIIFIRVIFQLSFYQRHLSELYLSESCFI